MMTNRDPNSHECEFFGRKMSNFITDTPDLKDHYVQTSKGYVVIGSDSDDEIYDSDGPDMLKQRVKIYYLYEPEQQLVDAEGYVDQNFYVEIDLEDILRFSANSCRGIYTRVLEETK